MKRFFSNLFLEHTILAICLLFSVGIYGITLYISHMQQEMMETLSLQNARSYSKTLSEFRTLYTSEVTKRAASHGLEITHDYTTKENAIPLPATLSIMLGIGSRRTLMQVMSGFIAHILFPGARILVVYKMSLRPKPGNFLLQTLTRFSSNTRT